MKIAIDCRYLGKSGIGRVLEGALEHLDFLDNEFYLIGNIEKLKNYDKAILLEDNSEPYSKNGLVGFADKINKKCDCIFIPNFLIPFGIKIPIFTIVHDLIFLDRKETVRGIFDKFIKHVLLKRCFKKSKHIFCDSHFTLSRCDHYFKKYINKCSVNYPGLSSIIIEYAANNAPISIEKKKNIILFVGNIKPHKGLNTLISVFNNLPKGHFALKIIGEKEKFLTKMNFDNLDTENIEFSGKLEDNELLKEISLAKFLVQPSYYEGFGLPPLEALCLGTQPIIRNIEVFREVYANLPVIYFENDEDLTAALMKKPDFIERTKDIEEKYNYNKFVCKVLEQITGKIC